MTIDLNKSIERDDENDLDDENNAKSTDSNQSGDSFQQSGDSISPGSDKKNNDSDQQSTDSDLETPPSSYIRDEIEKKLEVGSIIESLEEVYFLYCEYARLSGFSVKKGTQTYFQNSLEVRIKVFHCSCEGHPDNRRSQGKIAAYKKQVTRTNCKARLRVIREKDEPWTVSVFSKQHNHELVSADQSYMLRSARHMSNAKKSVLAALNSAGIPVSRAYRFMEQESGGRQNVGFIPKDAYTHISRLKGKTKVENGDANAVLQFFRDKSNKEPYFYWNVQEDDEGRLMNFFFRDTRCSIDYEVFGDVLSVDTTYRTNKYNLKCVPFVGINHHRSNVMFGIAFLSDETTKSFEWLFETFLESKYGKEPDVIFTDQCKALMNGIDSTFHSASHRLCQWHINQHAPSHFGSLKGNSDFKKLWHHCMNGCETEEDFNQTWKLMVESYDLGKRSWLKAMYNLRRRWATVFTNEKFSAGLHATSRSEVTNKVLKDLCSSSTSLHQFVIQYEKMQNNWRIKESEEDTLCRGMPGQFVQNNSLLTHAAELYTRNVFKAYEFEAAYSLNVGILRHPVTLLDEYLNYQLKSSSTISGSCTVQINRTTQHATCSCRMWETEGVICRHIFKVFYLLDVEQFPDQLIVKRWTKNVKNRFAPGEKLISHVGSENLNNMTFVNYHVRLIYNVLQDCKDDVICRDIISKRIKELFAEIMDIKPGLHGGSSKKKEKDNKESLHRSICNPPLPKKRRYPVKKLRRHWDIPRNKRGRNAAKKGNLQGKYETLVEDTHTETGPLFKDLDPSISSSYMQSTLGYPSQYIADRGER